ncbi:MAG: hypothetical protein HYV40_00810 [Candidatus Levybacteria bacterium]|nr:hypothetical protein [Candidatus Levybacteria bacterium]
MRRSVFLPIVFFSLALPLLSLFYITRVSAEDQATESAETDNTGTIKDLRKKITELTGKITELQGQERSLSSQIAVMDNQIKLTVYKIASTKEEIIQLESDIGIATNKVSQLEKSLGDITKVLIRRIQATYMAGSVSSLSVFLSADDLNKYLAKENYLKKMQAHDKQLMYSVQQAKVDYANQKQIYVEKQKKVEALKVQLETYNADLQKEKDNKKVLLAQTQGSEANYQRLLAQAKAQLEGFTRFTQNQGGASILSNQTVCDDWGCYYNQRDSQWGNLSLNGTQYTLASDGCLVTAMAMVMTHYGVKTLPSDINANPSNFASYYPAYLLYKISANGKTAERIGATIDSALSEGHPVVVGINAYGGTHFVVLRSGSSGNYMMNDPFVENGNNISFNAHYSVGNIFEIQKVAIY